MEQEQQEIKLTQYAHGAGCGCKIAPSVLEQILHDNISLPDNDKLVVGNSSRDDAAAYDLGDGNLLIATTDFFMPIVDDAFDYGRIASANAISDVYAMGGRPILATAILGWPVDKLSPELAQKVLDGSKSICAKAGIPLAGGHSIDSPEPIFGLAVNGLCTVDHLKKNNTANEGDILFLTKPIGVGVLATAQKRGMLEAEHKKIMIEQLVALNEVGAALGKMKGVTAMTDITGFGLMGHLIEMAEGSDLSAELIYSKVPVIDGARQYAAQRIVPDATYRNWNGYNTKVGFEPGVDVMESFMLLPDPQTNGGLLIAVDPASVKEVTEVLQQHGISHTQPIGKFTAKGEKVITVMK